MMQSLLADRFKLRVRWEVRSFPVYALRRTATDELGRNLKPIEAECPDGAPETVNAAPVGCAVKVVVNGGHVEGVIPSIKELERVLGALAGRHVVDETGLDGRFELTLAFDIRTVDGPLALVQPWRAEDLPSFADARVRTSDSSLKRRDAISPCSSSTTSSRPHRIDKEPEDVVVGPHWRWWAGRTIFLMGAVYLLGIAGLPTVIPYLAALLTVVVDGVRTARYGAKRATGGMR